MSELKPCPNPRCDKRELRKGASYSQNWRIECGSCGMSGPFAGTHELASERWNQLVDDMNAIAPERGHDEGGYLEAWINNHFVRKL